MGCPAKTGPRRIDADGGWKDPASASFWKQRGVSRRQFLGFCSAMAATLALPDRYIGRIAEALENVRRPSLVWLEFQDCAGNTES
ncbi:MAG TPA: twin-arginine translocation signal domain-containing protein, partial [Candidatus Methylomirabilis sp.]|nr:twin-arginine translocation signal domain-containing protein [Candidatus Methylomirabilis sp.]